MPRPAAHAQRLDRDGIIAAALALVRRGEERHLSMRRLAAELGVPTMTLYGYVDGRDEVIAWVGDALLAELWHPSIPAWPAWDVWILDCAERLLGLLQAHPIVLERYLRRPMATPHALERMEAMLEVLERAGFPEQLASSIYAAIHTYTIGFAALEAHRRGSASGGPPSPREAELAGFVTHEQFRASIGYLLRGAATAATSMSPPSGAKGREELP